MSVGMIQYSPTHACFGPAMQPCVGSSGTTASDQRLPFAAQHTPPTLVERAADGGDDGLRARERAERVQERAALAVDARDADAVDDWRGNDVSAPSRRGRADAQEHAARRIALMIGSNR
jgi:hypothetical protein